MKELFVKETRQLYTVSYQDGFKIKTARIWKNPIHSRLDIEHLGKNKKYKLERLIIRDGHSKSVYRKAMIHASVKPLHDLTTLMKEVRYFSKNFRPIFYNNLMLQEFLESHFFDINFYYNSST